MDIVISGLALAAIYALVASGLSLTLGGIGFLNLAHGATFAVGGFAAWWWATHVSADPFTVVGGSLVVGAVCGALVWAVVFLPLDGGPGWDLRSTVATLGLSLLGTNLLLEQFGPRARALPPVFGNGTTEFVGASATADQIGAIVVAAVLLVALILFLQRSRLGLGVRAITQNSEGAALVGMDRRSVALAILLASGAMAGAAGVLLASQYFVSANAGMTPMVKGLIVTILGGLGSMRGTVIAAIIVGFTEAATTSYLGGQYVLLTLFTLIAVVLLVRPRGIAGVLEVSRA